jgi:hypothetical protein
VRSVRIGAGLLSVAMSLKTVGLAAALFVVAPSAGSAVALLREATLVSAMLAGAAALFMVIGVGLLAGARGSRLVAMGVGVAGVLVVQASHVARLLHRGPADLRVPLSLVEIGLEVVLATCIAVLYAPERRVVTRVPPLGRPGRGDDRPRLRRNVHVPGS